MEYRVGRKDNQILTKWFRTFVHLVYCSCDC